MFKTEMDYGPDFRSQVAAQVLCVLIPIASAMTSKPIDKPFAAKIAVEFADALIAELAKESHQ